MDPFLGQIIMFGGSFAPQGWAFCEGQLLPINQNTALFSLLGTIYGGDGITTFALPDLRGRVPIGQGNGPGLAPRQWGEQSGTEQNTLNTTQLPEHNHALAAKEEGNAADPNGNFIAGTGSNVFGTASDSTMDNTSISNVGGGQPVNNMQPFLCVNFIIALEGVYPPRN